jgi:hypothetical protein
MKKKVERALKDFLIIIFAFVVISAIFLGINFGYKKIKSLTGYAVASEVITTNYIEWIVITLISAIVVVWLLEKIIKKNILKINWNIKEKTS